MSLSNVPSQEKSRKQATNQVDAEMKLKHKK